MERTLDGAQVGGYIHGQRTDEIIVANLKTQNAKLQTLYPLVDGLGSTVALTNKNSKVTERYRYTAYGQPTALKSDYSLLATGSSLLSTYRFLFTGREWLASVGLNDHRNRYYSPELGRWPSIDPLRFDARAINLYQYCGNNVYNNRDNNGLWATPTEYRDPSDDSFTVICNGGSLVVSSPPVVLLDYDCITAHENRHIEDWYNFYGRGVCIGAPEGKVPVGGDGYNEFLVNSECEAHKLSAACFQNKTNQWPSTECYRKPWLQVSLDYLQSHNCQ